MSKYRIGQPAFRLPISNKPVFLSRDRLFLLGSRGGVVFDTSTRKKTLSIKTCPNALDVALSESGDWVAAKNSSGEITVSRLSDGTLIHKYERAPYQESGQLEACSDEHFLDSTDGVVHLHSIRDGAIVQSYDYGDDGWMPEGLAFSKKRGQFVVGTTPKFGNPFREQAKSLLHFFDVQKASGPIATLEIPDKAARLSISPDEGRLAVLFTSKERDRIVLQVLGWTGELQASCEIEGRDVFFGSPTWTADGSQIVVICDLARIVILDSQTLQPQSDYFGPNVTGLAFQSNGDLIAITGESGFGGVVLATGQLQEWSELEGQKRQQQLADQFYAYSLQIKLRKACPPRAAVFMRGKELLFESEKLVGYFRYLPTKITNTLRLTDSTEKLGVALRETIDCFEEHSSAKEPVLGPGFGRDADYLAESGVSEHRLEYVRYLGHATLYLIDHVDVDLMISTTLYDGRIHFWLCREGKEGGFYEDCWPHAHLSASSSDTELGQALVKAIEQLPQSEKYIN